MLSAAHGWKGWIRCFRPALFHIVQEVTVGKLDPRILDDPSPVNTFRRALFLDRTRLHWHSYAPGGSFLLGALRRFLGSLPGCGPART